MLSLFYIATFYRKVMKCCFLGIKNLQIIYSYLNSMMHSISFCTVINASYFNTTKVTTAKIL